MSANAGSFSAGAEVLVDALAFSEGELWIWIVAAGISVLELT